MTDRTEAEIRNAALEEAAEIVSGAIGRGSKISEDIRALKSAPAAQAPAKGAGDDWRLDHSAGRPILVYQNCSVIEAEQAEYVLRLIEADRQQRGGDVDERAMFDQWFCQHSELPPDADTTQYDEVFLAYAAWARAALAAQPAASAEPGGEENEAWALAEAVRSELDRQSCPDAFMRIAVESIVKHARALLSRYGRPAGDAQSVRWLVTGQCGHDEYTRDAGEAHRVKEQRDKSYCGEDETRVVPLYAAPVAAQKVDDVRDAERWRELDRVASDPDFNLKCDAGGWNFFKGQIDAAIAQQRKGGK